MTFNIGSQQENTENPSVNMEQLFWLVCCGGGVRDIFKRQDTG